MRVAPTSWLARTRTAPTLRSVGSSATIGTGTPLTTSASTCEAPDAMVCPFWQLATWLESTAPTAIVPPVPPIWAPSMLEAAAITRSPRRVLAFGAVTVPGPKGLTPASARVSVAHGVPFGLAITGSLVIWPPAEARAALPRHVSAAWADAGTAIVAASAAPMSRSDEDRRLA